MNEDDKIRNEPEIPALLVGDYVCDFYVGNEIKEPVEIKQMQTSPLVAFLTNESYSRKERQKGPTAEPLPFIW